MGRLRLTIGGRVLYRGKHWITPYAACFSIWDNTLIDREGAFARFASTFYEERLGNATTMTRDEVVVRMVHQDQDGYVDRVEMFAKWVDEWPEAGLNPEQLLPWYRLEMKKHVLPDADINGFLANLNEHRVPWGIVTNGSTTGQHVACQAACLDQLAPFIIVSEAAGYKKPDPRIFSRRIGTDWTLVSSKRLVRR